MSDVLVELLRLSRCPDQVPSPRVQLLMVAAKDRLTSMDTLLMLLPLTAVSSYVWWFRRAAIRVAFESKEARSQIARGVRPVNASGDPLSPSLVSGFKAYLAAHPDQLGPYALLANSDRLQDAVCSDAGCSAPLAALPTVLLTEVCSRHSGVLPHSLYDVACMACGAASMMPASIKSVKQLTALMLAIGWSDILRICCLPMEPTCGGSEKLFHQALASMSLCCNPACCTLIPGLLLDLTGPYKTLLPLLRSLFSRLWKGAKAGSAIFDPAVTIASRSFVFLLSSCNNLEVMPTAVRRNLAEDYGFSDEAIRGFQSTAHEGLEALRRSCVWGVLEKLHEELSHAAASLTLAFGLIGLGSVLGVEPPVVGNAFTTKAEEVVQAVTDDTDEETAREQRLAWDRSKERMFLQVCVGGALEAPDWRELPYTRSLLQNLLTGLVHAFPLRSTGAVTIPRILVLYVQS